MFIIKKKKKKKGKEKRQKEIINVSLLFLQVVALGEKINFKEIKSAYVTHFKRENNKTFKVKACFDSKS